MLGLTTQDKNVEKITRRSQQRRTNASDVGVYDIRNYGTAASFVVTVSITYSENHKLCLR